MMRFKNSLLSMCMLSIFSAYAQDIMVLDHDDSLVIQHHLEYANHYFERQESRTASEFFNKAAYIYWEHDLYLEALRHYKQSFTIIEGLEDKNLLATVSNNIGTLYGDLSYPDSALYFFKINLEARESLGQKIGAISALVNIAVIYSVLEQYSDAIRHLDKARDYAVDIEDYNQLGRCYAALSEAFGELDKTEASMGYFQLFNFVNDLNNQGATSQHLIEIQSREKKIPR